MSIASMLESSAEIRRPRIGRDSAGGVTQDFIGGKLVQAAVACSYQEGSSRVKELYGQRNSLDDVTIYFGSNPNTAPNDQVKIVHGYTGATIYVNVLSEAESDTHGLLWAVICEKIDQPKVDLPS